MWCTTTSLRTKVKRNVLPFDEIPSDDEWITEDVEGEENEIDGVDEAINVGDDVVEPVEENHENFDLDSNLNLEEFSSCDEEEPDDDDDDVSSGAEFDLVEGMKIWRSWIYFVLILSLLVIIT